MIRGDARGRGLRHPGIAQFQPVDQGDPVQRRHRPRGVKAAPGRVHAEPAGQRLQPGAGAPFVEIAQDHRGHVVVEGGGQRGQLAPPVAAQQPQVHPDHPQAIADLDRDGAARSRSAMACG